MEKGDQSQGYSGSKMDKTWGLSHHRGGQAFRSLCKVLMTLEFGSYISLPPAPQHATALPLG